MTVNLLDKLRASDVVQGEMHFKTLIWHRQVRFKSIFLSFQSCTHSEVKQNNVPPQRKNRDGTSLDRSEKSARKI